MRNALDFLHPECMHWTASLSKHAHAIHYVLSSSGRGLMYCLQYSFNLFLHNIHEGDSCQSQFSATTCTEWNLMKLYVKCHYELEMCKMYVFLGSMHFLHI